MRLRQLALVLAATPLLVGFDGPQARDALDAALRNLYQPDVLVAVELAIDEGHSEEDRVSFAYGRKTVGDETRTLVYTGDGRRESARVLLFQKPGSDDRAFASEGDQGQVRPVPMGKYRQALFGSDFNYADFRTRRADDYRIEVLGEDKIDGEDCRVLRLRPLEGPYTMLLAWVSQDRPVILRTDYFDEAGLWKRYEARVDRIERQLEWWIPMEDEMIDLRTGRHTVRTVRNLVVGVDVPDQAFTLTQLARGRMPAF